MLVNYIKNSAALGVGLVVSLLLLEVLLRVFDPFGFIIQGEEIVLNKNITTKTIYGDTEVIKNVNSLGFIGDDISSTSENTIKLITIGGSTTACDALQLVDTWPEQLRLRLSNKRNNLWLNNAGFSGHSTYGHNILFRDHVAKLQPDYVFYLIGFNDVGLSGRSLGDNVLVADRDVRNYSLWGKIYFYATENIRIVSNITNLMRSFKAYQLNVNDLDFNINQVAFSDDDPELEKLLSDYHIKHYLVEYRKRVLSLIEQSRKAGSKAILITQPYLGGGDVIDEITGISLGKIAMPLGSSWAGVGDDWDAPIDKSRMVNANLMWKILELYNDVVREVSKEQKVVLVDMAMMLPKDTRYYYDMVHYTSAGSHEFAALLEKSVATYIK